jgi:hypothetical protein
VYAWNALADLRPDDAAELARIAREVNDQQLLREIERRGFSTELPQPVAEPEEPESKPLLRLRRLWPVLVVLLLVIAAVEIVPVESGPRHPTLDDVASGPESRRPTLNVLTGVWLVPLGDVTSVDVGRLANELALRYRIPVAALRGLALAKWTLDGNEQSLVAEQLIVLLRRSYRAHGRVAIVGITDYEMYASRKDHTHVFSWRAPPHYGVVSTSSLAANLFDRLHGHSRHERTRKLIARNIGFLYFYRAEVDDPHSLLRPPMHGAGDIDKLDETL